VPLARMEVSLTPTEAFSIVGEKGQRKRFLPVMENLPDDIWEAVESTLPALTVGKAELEQDSGDCRVMIVSSLLAKYVNKRMSVCFANNYYCC